MELALLEYKNLIWFTLEVQFRESKEEFGQTM
jgi:hypothetical protein